MESDLITLLNLVKIVVSILCAALIARSGSTVSSEPVEFSLLLVGATSTLFTISASHYLSNFPELSLLVTALVIIGAALIGAAQLFRNRPLMKGLKTASMIWVCACIGTALGLGLFIEAVLFTLGLYFFLDWLQFPRKF